MTIGFGPMYFGHGRYICRQCRYLISQCRCFDHPMQRKPTDPQFCPVCQGREASDRPPLKNFDPLPTRHSKERYPIMESHKIMAAMQPRKQSTLFDKSLSGTEPVWHDRLKTLRQHPAAWARFPGYKDKNSAVAALYGVLNRRSNPINKDDYQWCPQEEGSMGTLYVRYVGDERDVDPPIDIETVGGMWASPDPATFNRYQRNRHHAIEARKNAKARREARAAEKKEAGHDHESGDTVVRTGDSIFYKLGGRWYRVVKETSDSIEMRVIDDDGIAAVLDEIRALRTK